MSIGIHGFNQNRAFVALLLCEETQEGNVIPTCWSNSVHLKAFMDRILTTCTQFLALSNMLAACTLFNVSS